MQMIAVLRFRNILAAVDKTAARDYGCDYVILRKDRKVQEPLTDFDFLLYAQTEHYLIYQDRKTETGD